MTLEVAWKLLLAQGGLPQDVIVTREGEKLPAKAAMKKDYQWDVIYFRDDGYTLAADYYMAPYVRQSCTDPDKKWIGKIFRGELKPKPI